LPWSSWAGVPSSSIVKYDDGGAGAPSSIHAMRASIAAVTVADSGKVLPRASCSGVITRGIRPALRSSSGAGITGELTSVWGAPATHQLRRHSPSPRPGRAM